CMRGLHTFSGRKWGRWEGVIVRGRRDGRNSNGMSGTSKRRACPPADERRAVAFRLSGPYRIQLAPTAMPLVPNSSPGSRQTVNILRAPQTTAALAIASLAIACSTEKPADTTSAASAKQQSMDSMSMSAPVTIPKGAIYTEADVHFVQGMIAHHAQAIF